MNYSEIPLTRGQVAIVDAADYDSLEQWKWTAFWNPSGKTFYAVRRTSRKEGKRRTIYMHREICGDPAGLIVDHRDHNTLNNQRSNLRLATSFQSARNQRRHTDNKSGAKGVMQRGRKWITQIMIDGKNTWKSFATREQAVEAYAALAKAHHGEFACTE